MKVPFQLKQQLNDILVSLPLDSATTQAAFVRETGIPTSQLHIGTDKQTFAINLTSFAENYGTLTDPPIHALLSLILTARRQVGAEQRGACDVLLELVAQYLGVQVPTRPQHLTYASPVEATSTHHNMEERMRCTITTLTLNTVDLLALQAHAEKVLPNIPGIELIPGKKHAAMIYKGKRLELNQEFLDKLKTFMESKKTVEIAIRDRDDTTETMWTLIERLGLIQTITLAPVEDTSGAHQLFG